MPSAVQSERLVQYQIACTDIDRRRMDAEQYIGQIAQDRRPGGMFASRRGNRRGA